MENLNIDHVLSVKNRFTIFIRLKYLNFLFMKNPKWHRDEIILALELYFELRPGEIHARNPRIIALSEILNKLPIYTNRPDAVRFRNPNGVALKLSNFLAIDPAYHGSGMASYSKLDKNIFDEFQHDHDKLFLQASQIRNSILQNSEDQVLNDSGCQTDCFESQTQFIDNNLNDEINENEQQLYVERFKKEGKTKEQLLDILSERKKQKNKTENYQGSRNKRDNESIAIIKYLRNFECQICGKSILKADGTYYVEAAHIDPKRDKGKETLENILLLCPNHHKEFDLGKREILYRDDKSVSLKINGRTYNISLIL